MMQINALRKNKVMLSDYPYRRDIEDRLFLAQLNSFEVDLLREIISHSLKISILQLAETLETDTTTVLIALDKLAATKLFQKQNLNLIVDKERRKYYESHIAKFDEDFKPDMEFLQGLLGRIPIHVLPNWYAIPRSSDNIFASIVEKYFLTPKVYRQHLEELQFDEPILGQMVKDLYQNNSNFCLSAPFFLNKYQLSREQFEEYVLLLEYNFVGCLSYRKINDQWEEVLTPFHEWQEYLRFEAEIKPVPIEVAQDITYTYDIDFGFIKHLQTFLRACETKKMTVSTLSTLINLPVEILDRLIAKATQLELVQLQRQSIQLTDKGALWLMQPIMNQALNLFNDPLNCLQSFSSPLCTMRNIRQVEKSLRRLKPYEWIYLDDFLKGFILPLGSQPPVTLVNKGRKWKYSLPIYSNEEWQLIRTVLTERLVEIGIIGLGIHQEKMCMCLTAFGRQIIF